MRRITAAVVAAVASMAVPAAASADSGSITNVVPLSDGTVQATYTATSSTCTSYGFCGWYPHARQVPAGQACGPWVTDDSIIYVGDYQDSPGTQTGTDTFYPAASAVRLCLYIDAPDDSEPLVAQYDYSTPTSAPTPAPSPRPVRVRPLTIRDAKATLPHILRREYHSRFTHPRHFRRSCYRYTTHKVRCDVRWDHGRFRYRGNVTMRNDPTDPENTVLYTIHVHRTRLHPRHKSSPPRQTCDPNYGGCLDPYASDYDCAGGSGDGPRYTGPVRVIGDDHYGLDRDGDGIGCNDS